MLKLQFTINLEYLVGEYGADFILNVHAAKTPHQQVVHEQFSVSQQVSPEYFQDADTSNRYVRLRAAAGPLSINYEAVVELLHYRCQTDYVREVAVAQLPAGVLKYIYPSRYCESDRLNRLAIREFGLMPKGYARVTAIQKWVQSHVAFTSNSTDANTSAVDTLIEQTGVCRDFAHLMIALCRALSIPARFVTGTDFGANPELGPPDFHAYVEVYLENRWFIFDPSGTSIPMGLVRIGTGRDAADVAFATIFGTVTSHPPRVLNAALGSGDTRYFAPTHCDEALSTCG